MASEVGGQVIGPRDAGAVAPFAAQADDALLAVLHPCLPKAPAQTLSRIVYVVPSGAGSLGTRPIAFDRTEGEDGAVRAIRPLPQAHVKAEMMRRLVLMAELASVILEFGMDPADACTGLAARWTAEEEGALVDLVLRALRTGRD